MRKIIISIILALGCSVLLKAQDVLPIVTDARSAAMGDTGLSFSANAFSIYNYSGVIALDESEWAAGYTYGAWMPSFNLHSLHTVSGYFKPSERHGISAGIRYFSYPGADITIGGGEVTGRFSPFDIVFDLGYGFAVNGNLAVAANIRYLGGKKSDLADSKAASTFGADVGVYYRKNSLSAAAALSNIGSKINYGGGSHHMPARFKAAAGYNFYLGCNHMINGALEAAYAFLPKNYTGFEAGIGLEYIYNGMIAIRAGYRLGNSEDNPDMISENFGSSLSYATLGAGINLNSYSLDISYILAGSNSPLRNTVRVSLGVKF